MNARTAKNQLASNSALQMPKFRLQSSVRLRPAPKQQQQLQQVQQQQQQQLLQAVMMPEPVLQTYSCISKPSRPANAQPCEATPTNRLYMTVQSEDVDMYGVVTNTMYHKYMYAARAALGASVGLSYRTAPMDVVMERYGVMMATTSFTANIKSPLQYGDRFYAESVPCEVRGATCKFKERVVRVSSTGEHVVAAEGLASCVALVPAVTPVWPAPCMIPAPMREALLHCMAADAETAAAK